MIEDDELRILFQAETEERLKSLEENLRNLEINPQDKESIESAFRDAHTIKGSARMLDIQSIEAIAHQIENHLDDVRKDDLILSHQIIQTIYESLHAIQALAEEVITGKPANVDVSLILSALSFKSRESDQSASSSDSAKIEKQEKEQFSFQTPPQIPLPWRLEQDLTQLENRKTEKREKPSSLSTIRIDMQSIHNLVNQAAELTVTKNRVSRLFECIEEILNIWEKEYQSYAFVSYENKQREEEWEVMNRAMINVWKELDERLKQLRSDAYEDVHKLEVTVSFLVDQIRKLSLIPLSKLFDLFPRMIRDLSQTSGKEVRLQIEGAGITVDKKIIEDMKDPLMHLLRNAVSHGIEPPEERIQRGKASQGLIQLIGKQTPTYILIEVRDDGRGLDTEKIRTVALQRQMVSEQEAAVLTTSDIHSLIFLPGFSTATQISDISGRGVGLDVVKNQIEKLNGTLTIHSNPGQGSLFSIQLPISHLTAQVVLVQAGKRIYALPMEMIEACLLLSSDQISHVEGCPIIALQNQPVSLIFLRQLIGLTMNSSIHEEFPVQPCIIVRAQDKGVALVVDAILDEQKVIVIPPNRLLLHLKSIVGTTILKTGEVAVILNPLELVRSTLHDSNSIHQELKDKELKVLKNKKTILLVEDSHTTRVLLVRALEKEGYHVVAAENGLDGWHKLLENTIACVITDIQMPKMDGFTLISNIRRQPAYYHLPIILLTTLSSEKDKEKGMALGANAYLIKSDPEYQTKLFQTLSGLLIIE